MRNFKKFFFVVLSFFAFCLGNKLAFCFDNFEIESLSSKLTEEFSNNIYVIHNERNCIIGGIIGIIGIAFIYLYKKYDRKNYKENKEHGSAEWGTSKDIQDLKDKNEDKNKIFTSSEIMTTNTRQTQKNNNTIVIGGSREWKNENFCKAKYNADELQLCNN